MKRRAFIRDSGAAALVGALAGCTGGGGSPGFTLSIAETQITETENGYVAAEIAITNPGSERQSGMLYVTTELNGETSVEVRNVTLPPHSTEVVEVAYDVKYANVTSFSPSATIRPAEDDD